MSLTRPEKLAKIESLRYKRSALICQAAAAATGVTAGVRPQWTPEFLALSKLAQACGASAAALVAEVADEAIGESLN